MLEDLLLKKGVSFSSHFGCGGLTYLVQEFGCMIHDDRISVMCIMFYITKWKLSYMILVSVSWWLFVLLQILQLECRDELCHHNLCKWRNDAFGFNSFSNITCPFDYSTSLRWRLYAMVNVCIFAVFKWCYIMLDNSCVLPVILVVLYRYGATDPTISFYVTFLLHSYQNNSMQRVLFVLICMMVGRSWLGGTIRIIHSYSFCQRLINRDLVSV